MKVRKKWEKRGRQLHETLNSLSVEKMDRISGLPKIILHDILSRLPRKDAARTSVLSKAWRDTWYTFPIFAICDTQIVGTFPQQHEGFLRKRDIFIKYVEKTLLRKRDIFRDQGLAMKEFKLSMNCFDLDYMSRDVDLWMKLATECGVEVLDLSLPSGYEQFVDSFDPWYTLQQGVPEAKSLNKLVLMGGVRVEKAFLNHSVKFFSLRVLSLWCVLLGDEGVIEHLISHCPLIEQITLKRCYVYNSQQIGNLRLYRTSPLKSLSLNGLQKLKGVDIQGIQELYIDAPNLENLLYCPNVKKAPFKLNFASCRNLRQLNLWSLKDTAIEDKWFLDLFSNFPFLENLKLVACSMSERINISSPELKVLELSNCYNMMEINIDAPKLLSCGYCGPGDDKPVISFLRSSSRLEVIVVIDIDYAKLCNLRKFIQSFKPQNVLASLSITIHSFGVKPNVNVLQVLSPLPNIKHLYLQAVPENEALYLLVVNGLLSSCCPETISLSLDSYFCCKAFIKFLYETLIGRRQDECYCSSGDTKCWWHGLKNVKVTSSVKIDENVDFETLLDALPTNAIEDNISFRLEV